MSELKNTHAAQKAKEWIKFRELAAERLVIQVRRALLLSLSLPCALPLASLSHLRRGHPGACVLGASTHARIYAPSVDPVHTLTQARTLY